MEALGELTGGIAHEFNNLLAGMTGGMDLAKSRLSRDSVTKADIDEAQANLDTGLDFANRAAALTHRLLSLARRGAVAPSVVNMRELLQGLEGPIRRVVGRDTWVAVEAAEGLWRTRVDMSELENDLLNLVINGRDAMPGGGRFTLRGANVSLGLAQAEPLALPAGDYVLLSAEDTGVGMSADVAAKAFERFFTTKPAGKGTGLGLSMIYRFARASGGHDALESRPGEGTTVLIPLPRWIERTKDKLYLEDSL